MKERIVWFTGNQTDVNGSEAMDYTADMSTNTINEKIADNLDKIEREITVNIEHNNEFERKLLFNSHNNYNAVDYNDKYNVVNTQLADKGPGVEHNNNITISSTNDMSFDVEVNQFSGDGSGSDDDRQQVLITTGNETNISMPAMIMNGSITATDPGVRTRSAIPVADDAVIDTAIIVRQTPSVANNQRFVNNVSLINTDEINLQSNTSGTAKPLGVRPSAPPLLLQPYKTGTRNAPKLPAPMNSIKSEIIKIIISENNAMNNNVNNGPTIVGVEMTPNAMQTAQQPYRTASTSIYTTTSTTRASLTTTAAPIARRVTKHRSNSILDRLQRIDTKKYKFVESAETRPPKILAKNCQTLNALSALIKDYNKTYSRSTSGQIVIAFSDRPDTGVDHLCLYLSADRDCGAVSAKCGESVGKNDGNICTDVTQNECRLSLVSQTTVEFRHIIGWYGCDSAGSYSSSGRAGVGAGGGAGADSSHIINPSTTGNNLLTQCESFEIKPQNSDNKSEEEESGHKRTVVIITATVVPIIILCVAIVSTYCYCKNRNKKLNSLNTYP
ncbi:unnamed protein product [Medioppia subpectinata]|uniref:Uncharacterized protein n=1 Tax=Medioppia subpectinata TaxID=1979941 RepID=A0A7R9L107_9ACAR|nr:unnamed protein product [Medioppia subpectinata]CAG2113497.1 unnamed protein product [Medioppia subpectinata]